jgi:NAD(P)-dependent dehydrogenase (short-subunit alcohol dehydrogenase family)
MSATALYGGITGRRITVRDLARAKEAGERWPMLTAYDAQTARVFDEAGIPVLLVGDSAAMVVYGYDSTVPVTVEELLPLAAAVVRGSSRALVVGDLPFGSYHASPAQALRDLDLTGWQRVLDVNLTGTLLAAKAVAPHMAEAGSGSVVTIASIAAKRPEAGPLAYAVSKAGVWMLTKSLARSLAPTGVRVNAIGPGFIETNMTEFLRTNDAIKQMALTQIPLGRIGTPTDVANAALFLASDEASYFTGEILHPDGGFYTE